MSGGQVELSGLQEVHVWARMRGVRRVRRIGRSVLECMTACLEKECVDTRELNATDTNGAEVTEDTVK
jgi:hypothetical protein